MNNGDTRSKKNRNYIFDSISPDTVKVSPNIKISVITTEKELKEFYKVSWIVYKDDKNWIAPFWIEIRDFFKSKNPFWTHAETKLYIAYKDKPIKKI